MDEFFDEELEEEFLEEEEPEEEIEETEEEPEDPLTQLIKGSRCFGVAWDGGVKECKICEVGEQCRAKMLNKDPKEITKKEEVKPMEEKVANEEVVESPVVEEKPKKKKRASKPKPEVHYSPDMPEFRPMGVEEMMVLAKERGIDTEPFEAYTSTPIKKMRLTMALKKTYEIEPTKEG